MIRKSINLLGVSALLFAMGGCTTTGGLAPPSVASVQQALKNGCNYELLASTAVQDIAAVAATLGQAGPAAVAVTAAQVADAICKSVNAIPVPAPTGRLGVPVHGGFLSAGTPVIVNGVPVHGAFIK